MKFYITITLVCATLFFSCAPKSPLPKTVFGKLPNGRVVEMFTLKNANGMTAQVMNYGATLTSVKVSDNMGRISEVTLGFDSLQGYIDHPRLGSVVGRYGNRLARGKFTLNGQEYTLAVNNGPNHLHGGKEGFDKKIWKAQPFINKEGEGVTFTYTSADGEEGYPGALKVSVTYIVRVDNSLKIDYAATTTKPTVLNLTNHAYFNLKDGRSNVLDHVIKINASRYTPIDETKIPTGELASVEGTPLDFRQPQAIGARIKDEFEQLRFAGGYDHNFIVDGGSGRKYVATVFEPESGRVLNVVSDQPGVQFYSANFLSGFAGRTGAIYQPYHGFCLETQHFPDSPNHDNFPSTVLNPGETFQSTTIYKFTVSGVNIQPGNAFF